MDRTPVRELLGILDIRAGLLDCLKQGLTDKRMIEARLDVKRSTVNRGLDKLREAELITTHPIRPELTVFGKIALEEYQEAEDKFTDLVEAKPLLRYLPVDAQFDMRIVEDAEVLISQEIAPLEPILRLEEMIRQSDAHSARGLSPLILPRFVEFIHGEVMNADLSGEFMFEDEVLDYLLQSYNPEVRDVIESGRVAIRRLKGPGLSYGLALMDEVGVWVGVYERGGGLRGAVINMSDQAFEWAEEIYSGLRDRSTPVELEDIRLR